MELTKALEIVAKFNCFMNLRETGRLVRRNYSTFKIVRRNWEEETGITEEVLDEAMDVIYQDGLDRFADAKVGDKIMSIRTGRVYRIMSVEKDGFHVCPADDVVIVYFITPGGTDIQDYSHYYLRI